MGRSYTTGMRDQDARIFRAAAVLHRLYLLTRHANPESLKYVGVRGYEPKPFFIKSKTARANGPVKNGRLPEIAGLVVDPNIHPELYEGPRLEQARDAWASDLRHVRSGRAPGVSVQVDEDPQSKHFGCLQLRRSVHTPFAYLHTDYDLKDIIEVGHETQNERVANFRYGLKHYEVRLARTNLHQLVWELNKAMGVAMVQHGSEAQFTGHTGEPITAFFPDGNLSVHEGEAIEAFYARLGRPTHGVTDRTPRDGRKAPSGSPA